jgi:hypothetical protein
VDLTPDEWMAGIQFLTATGQKCDEKRQEFILLSDTLGLSMLVVALEQARGAKALADQPGEKPTEATVQGPFFWPGAPEEGAGRRHRRGLRRAHAVPRAGHRHLRQGRSRTAKLGRLVRRRGRPVRHAEGRRA